MLSRLSKFKLESYGSTPAAPTFSTLHTIIRMTARFSVGIDLGTTNSVVAATELECDQPILELLPIPQFVAAGQVETRNSLPSFIYIAPENENTTYQLHWQDRRSSCVVGELARQKGADSPHRVISAAKSWLAHHGVNRREAILPWQSPDEVAKISPLSATEAFLHHLVGAWNDAHPDAPLAEQKVVLTVPASFDPAARNLTREAALAAGLPADFVLLEEPQAAVYRWLADEHESWRDQFNAGDTLLVVDVGGGTTDLTLIRLDGRDGRVELERLAVGNHLLVGGDNMDLALAHLVANQLAREGHSLDPWQNVALWHSCRTAKEQLLACEGPETITISVLGRGSRLIGGTLSTHLSRDATADLLINGFFPHCKATEKPERFVASGFQDLGLPYESDPAITKHIAAFLASCRGTSSDPLVPTHLLLNGGVFRSSLLQDAVSDTLTQWAASTTGKSPQHLSASTNDLDHAVAKGAAYYGWSKQRGGLRIRGGTARSYYIGIETAGLAIPGAPRPLRALCVAPRGMEEGTAAEIPSQEVGLMVGRPAKFRFFSSSVRPHDVPGDRLDQWSPDELVESDSIQTTLTSQVASDDSFLPVRFQSRVTELGMFELYCRSTRGDEQWQLEFNAREAAKERQL